MNEEDIILSILFAIFTLLAYMLGYLNGMRR